MFKEIIELSPESADAYYGWGAVLVQLRRHEEAIEKLKKAAELKPDDLFVPMNLMETLKSLESRKRQSED